MINFILEYWFIAALAVAVWAFFKFTIYNYHRNVANVNGENNTPLQFGGTSKELEKQATELIKEYKSNLR